MLKLITQVIALLLIASGLHAQPADNSIAIGTKEKITSRILKEDREIFVYKPEKVNVRLSLILVFDGESLFSPVVSAVQFMNHAQELPQIPEAVVVGIPNTDRNRDMPIPQMYGKEGEENFSRFLAEELIPMLTQKYRLNGQIVLIGHSQGGLFVSYLLTRSPDLYKTVIALDAPMDVDVKVAGIKQKIGQQLEVAGSKVRYASLEMAFGWGKDWETTMAKSKGTVRLTYPNETHESMPFKAIYDGLKFIYQGFAPTKRDMTLNGLLHYYKDVSEALGYEYEIPSAVLLASANRKIMDIRKDDALALLSFAEDRYGSSERITVLRNRASGLNAKPDPIVDFYLTHAKPTAKEIKPYLGRWVGELIVTRGQPIPIDMEIKVENGKGTIVSVLPWPPHDKVETEIVFVNDKGELVYGRKNRGAGLIISTGHIANDGNLKGKESLVGFTIPDDVPDEVKEMMKFTMENSNTFNLKRVK